MFKTSKETCDENKKTAAKFSARKKITTGRIIFTKVSLFL